MNYSIRPIREEEYGCLDEFLYQAVFAMEGAEKPDREIIRKPELQVYVDRFGEGQADFCLLAEADGKTVGAVWSRIMNDYGHISDGIPSLAVSLLPEYRNKGIGTALMKEMLALLKEKGYSQVSLSVQKDNYAVKLYRKSGFRIYRERENEYLMLADL
ncbi:MAG: GNAT family N-acetyltransferase [Erysipelotrichaceae bacterium]|nr:GNAT family N-acetyltransferase [Erysipelotrichaceae bacterium]